MASYNDYMINVSAYFISYADLYCNLLRLGKDDCCLKNKLNVLSMYIDALFRTVDTDCLSDDDISILTEHINTLCNSMCWGTIDTTTITSLIGNPWYLPTSTSSTNSSDESWNKTIGLTPTTIAFTKNLGNSGTDWSLVYTAVNSSGQTVDVAISGRTSGGFIATAYENNVTFEGTATLNTI